MRITKERLKELLRAAEKMEEWYGIDNAVIRLTTAEFLAILKLIDLDKLSEVC